MQTPQIKIAPPGREAAGGGHKYLRLSCEKNIRLCRDMKRFNPGLPVGAAKRHVGLSENTDLAYWRERPLPKIYSVDYAFFIPRTPQTCYYYSIDGNKCKPARDILSAKICKLRDFCANYILCRAHRCFCLLFAAKSRKIETYIFLRGKLWNT